MRIEFDKFTIEPVLLLIPENAAEESQIRELKRLAKEGNLQYGEYYSKFEEEGIHFNIKSKS